MSLETTIAQGVARDAEAAWSRHRKTCAACGDKRRGAKKKCGPGAALAADARELRQTAREAAQADREPGENQPPLFDLDEVPGYAGPWLVKQACGHECQTNGKPRVGSFISCLKCQGQRKVISVTAGQKGTA